MRPGRDQSAAAVAHQRLAATTEECPFEKNCPCRRGPWCRRKGDFALQSPRDYRMMSLEGCREGRCDHPCELLLQVENLANYLLEAAGITEPPVPLDLITTFDPVRPVEIRFLPLNAHYGAVWLLGDEWVLHLNANQPLPMNRYVAFHEGYHIVCRVSGLYAGETGDSCRPFHEVTADYFAASILMPRGWVREYWPKARSVSRMAEVFEAPEAAVRSWVRRWIGLWA